MADKIKTEQGPYEPTPAQSVQQVMSPMGAQGGITLTAEEIEIIKRLRQQGQPHLSSQPAPPGQRTITIPDELANSIFGQVTRKQMEMQWQKEQENIRAADRIGMTPQLKAMFDQQQPIFGVPTMKQMKLQIKKFDGTEPYKGLGASFAEWGTKFMRHIAMAQLDSGFWWASEYKLDCLSSHLDGKALRYFESQIPIWMQTWPFLEYVMEQMHNAYRVRLTMEQAVTCAEAIEAIEEVDSVCNISVGDPLTYKAAMKTNMLSLGKMPLTSNWILYAPIALG
jgi:hypothetical protein